MTCNKDNELKFFSNNFCTNIPILLPVKDDQLREKSLAEMGYDPNRMPNWSDISQPKKPKLEQLLLAKISKYEQTNLEIHIDGTIFRCHMLVLQCYSEYFCDLTGTDKVVLPAQQSDTTIILHAVRVDAVTGSDCRARGYLGTVQCGRIFTHRRCVESVLGVFG